MAECITASPEHIQRAAAALKAGKLVAFGTETVYGLGGDATNDHAVASIFEAKGRPRFNPLISHVADIETVFRHGKPTPLAEKLADAFWPGPMTLVLTRIADCPVSPLALADLDSIALRVPANPLARAFLSAAATPVAAPSANRSGRISPSRAEHVMDDLGDSPHLAFVLDTGAATEGIESTVIDALGERPVILRPGSITAADIEAVTGIAPLTHNAANDAVISPGQLKSHYAPRLPLKLNASTGGPETAFIGFGDASQPDAGFQFNLSPDGDLVEAAAQLYHLLRAADQSGATEIAMAPIPHVAIGIAINDRLRRAAQRD